MDSHAVLAAITSASSFLASQQRIVTDDSLNATQRSMMSSLVLQIGQLSELSSDYATMMTDAIEASAFDQVASSTLAVAIGNKMAAAGSRTTAGPKGQACLTIKDFT